MRKVVTEVLTSNQLISEDELGRGVHGKVRLAWDTETGERVAVKIVERQSRKRLGGGSDWTSRVAAKARVVRGGLTGGNGREEEVDPIHAHMEASRNHSPGLAGNAGGDSGSTDTEPRPKAHFAPSPARSPTRSPARSPGAGAGAMARHGRWGHGLPTREELEERERAKKALLWTTDKKVKREVAIMKKCQHENVVKLREVIDDPQSKKIFMGACYPFASISIGLRD